MPKYWIKYKKGEDARFISHLDLLRAMDRSIRRAGIPIAYSQGFNPHQKLSFATPLSVGVTSDGDYLEMELKDQLTTSELLKLLNQTLPAGIQILKAQQLDGKKPSLGAIVKAALYKVSVNGQIKDDVEELLNQEEILIERTNRKGTKIINIRPLIYELYIKENLLYMLLANSSSDNVRPKEILDILSIKNPNIDKLETYCSGDKDDFITPLEWLNK